MPGWIGPWELAILLVVVLLVFGPKRLPEMGRSLGRGMREFKHSITGKDGNRDDSHEELTAVAEEETPLATASAPERERDAI
jgi:sec-independent protein translocase protein TatA